MKTEESEEINFIKEKELFAYNIMFKTRIFKYEDNFNVEYLINDKKVELYECDDYHEAEVSFNTINDTIRHTVNAIRYQMGI